MLQRLKGNAVAAYRSAPISTRSRIRIKGALFRLFGFALSDTQAYKGWKDQQQATRQLKLRQEALSAGYRPTSWMERLSARLSGVQPPRSANADAWQDYGPIKAAINDSHLRRRQDARVKPVDTIKLSQEQIDLWPSGFPLPAPVDKPDVTIVIPVFGHVQLTLECLASIAKWLDASGPTIEIIIADDASTDATARILSATPNIRVVTQASNVGFLENCNSAARHARGDAILFLNNDAQVTRGWLAALFSELNSAPDVGAAGSQLLYPNGRLQEAGARIRRDGSAELIGLGDDPSLPAYAFSRDVDYCSGASLLVRRDLFERLDGFDPTYKPAYCEDMDLCLRIREAGYRVRYCAGSRVVHHLSKSSEGADLPLKTASIARNTAKVIRRWQSDLDAMDAVRTIAFYLPQFHPIAENDLWWGRGFTEWTNVTKATPNFNGHYQPRRPADLGYYDLRLPEVMRQQARLAAQYGVDGFCFYYYWFHGKRLLERPIEQMLVDDKNDFPFCLCWANENWTRRWDGRDSEILMGQQHSDEDDRDVILDIARFFRKSTYIRIGGRPLLLVYRTGLFPEFSRTARIWREVCREEGIGEIYIACVESFEQAARGALPEDFGCDASVEFPPHGMAEFLQPKGKLLNPAFRGSVADYRHIAVRYGAREAPAYKRFPGVIPGWDNTARRQDDGVCFQNATPGGFQAWLESAIEKARRQFIGDERLVFINAWNEWAEGAYLEPDQRYGHGFLQAVANAKDHDQLVERA
ncbi:MAG TPA: glycoside hydrolase family 99-like domain-containing protein [Lysobacter sp.]